MLNREKVIAKLEKETKRTYAIKTSLFDGKENKPISETIHREPFVTMTIEMADKILELLKEQELPTELKQKMWNAFYAEEDEYEKKFVGKEEHLNWFTVYRPWLQKGFNIAIDAIADWEGR